MFSGSTGVLDRRELLHERLVDREAAGGVVDDDVVAAALRLVAGACVQISSGVAPGHVEDRDADLLAEDLELLDGGGALHVGRDEERLLPLLLQVARELGAGGRLPGALEADHHDARSAPLSAPL